MEHHPRDNQSWLTYDPTGSYVTDRDRDMFEWTVYATARAMADAAQRTGGQVTVLFETTPSIKMDQRIDRNLMLATIQARTTYRKELAAWKRGERKTDGHLTWRRCIDRMQWMRARCASIKNRRIKGEAA